jgi:ketosteroid isomerase-like protein
MESGVEVVREIIAALSRGDVDAMLARMHPDFEWRPLEGSPAARVCHGHAEVRDYVHDWLGTFDDLRMELDDPVQVGDRVVANVRGFGRGRASGVALDTRFCQVWTLDGETALAMEEHSTRAEGLAAAGAA